MSYSETDLMYKRWKIEFSKLEKDTDHFRTYYANTKKCFCPIEECQHYRRAKKKIFGNRINELFNLRLQISIQTFNKANSVVIQN